MNFSKDKLKYIKIILGTLSQIWMFVFHQNFKRGSRPILVTRKTEKSLNVLEI